MNEPRVPDIEPDQASDAAQAILRGRAYREAARPPSLRERAIDWIAELFSDLFAALSSGGGRGLIGWLIVVVFVMLIAYLLYRLFGQGIATVPVRRAGTEISVEDRRSAREWIQAAEAAERDGDWREGLRCRHRSLTVELVDRGIVDDRPGQTAFEIAQQASARRPAAGDELIEATAIFEEVWYGWREPTADTNRGFAASASTILEAADAADAADVAARDLTEAAVAP